LVGVLGTGKTTLEVPSWGRGEGEGWGRRRRGKNVRH